MILKTSFNSVSGLVLFVVILLDHIPLCPHYFSNIVLLLLVAGARDTIPYYDFLNFGTVRYGTRGTVTYAV